MATSSIEYDSSKRKQGHRAGREQYEAPCPFSVDESATERQEKVSNGGKYQSYSVDRDDLLHSYSDSALTLAYKLG